MNKITSTLLMTLFTGSLTFGDVVAINNLTEAYDSDVSYQPTSLQAVEFTTGNSAGGYELSSITFLQGSGAAIDANGIVALYSATGSDTPGTELYSMNTPAGSGSAGAGTSVTATGSYSLDAQTSYFVVLSSLGSSYNAETTASSTDTQADASLVGAGWSIGNKLWTKSGANWSSIDAPPLQVGIGVIPEPATLSLLALLGGGLLLIRRVFLI